MVLGIRSFPRIPLPAPGPRKYKRHNFFKAIGLEVFFLLKSSHAEQPKPVYTISLKTALAASGTHLLPVSASIAVISLNLVHLYLGQEYTGVIASQQINDFLLQLASKIQEMTIVASLTAIVLVEIRRELVHGQGVPLGSLGAAFSFTSLSYLWSPGFVGMLRSHTSTRSKARLCAIILLSMLLAAFVGPSTATLIIPKPKWWAAGGAKLWIRGDNEDVYPVLLSDRDQMQTRLCSQANATEYPVCPSFGYTALLQRSKRGNFQIFNQSPVQQTTRKLALGDSTEIILPGGMNQVEYMSLQTSFRGEDCQTGAIAPRLSESLKLAYFWHDFDGVARNYAYNPLNPSWAEYKRRIDDYVESQTRIPMVKTACSAAQNLSATDNEIVFPVMVQNDCWSNELPVNVPQTVFGQNATSRIRTSWFQLPSAYGPTSTGLIFESPWDASSDTRLVVGCSITAGWGNGTINQHSRWIFRGAPDYQAPWNRSYDNGRSSTVPDTTWQTIDIQKEWLKTLTPMALDQVNSSASTLDVVLEQSGLLQDLVNMPDTQETIWNQALGDGKNRSVMVEHMLSVTFSEALAREGTLRILVPNSGPVNVWGISDMGWSSSDPTALFRNAGPYLQPTGTPATSVQATMYLNGICYLAASSSDFFSIGVLLVHVVVALTHIIRLLIIRESSGSWHNLTELIALAHNSEPSRTVLRNTGAGIKELKTYGKVAVVRARQQSAAETPSPDNLTLIFRDDPDQDIELQGLMEADRCKARHVSHERELSRDSGRASSGGREHRSIENVKPDVVYG